jgi:tetratricopeptide (TPR) repeat protein
MGSGVRSSRPPVMKPTAFLLAVVVLAILPGARRAWAQSAANPPSADELFARGVQLQQAGDVLGAIEAYENALELDPARVDARSNLGVAYVRLGRYDEAIEAYRKVLEAVPDQPQVRLNLALALYKAGRIPEAAQELEKLVAQAPHEKQAILLLADCRAQMGDDAGVVSLLTPLEAEFKDDRLYAYLLGNALLKRNELQRGQKYIDRLFEGGESAEGHLLMGVAHMGHKDYRAAVPELERAVALNPKLLGAHSLLGRALVNSGRRDEAIKAFRTELTLNPNDFDSNLYLGIMLKDDGKLDEAYAHLERARRLRSQDVAVMYALGALQLLADRIEEARQLLEAVTQKVPSYREAHVLLATVYYREKKKDLGDRERAIAEKLRAEAQAKEPGAAPDLGPAYRGGLPTPPSEAPSPQPSPSPQP